MEQILQTSTLISIFLVLGAFVACGLGIVRLYNHSLPVVYPTPRPIPIGGWLIVIAVLEVLSVFSYMVQIFQLDIWQEGFWTYVSVGEAPQYYYLILTLNFFFTLNAVFTFCGAAFSIFLLYKQRDIFPKVLTWYSIISISVYCTIEIISQLIDDTTGINYITLIGVIGAYSSISRLRC